MIEKVDFRTSPKLESPSGTPVVLDPRPSYPFQCLEEPLREGERVVTPIKVSGGSWKHLNDDWSKEKGRIGVYHLPLPTEPPKPYGHKVRYANYFLMNDGHVEIERYDYFLYTANKSITSEFQLPQTSQGVGATLEVDNSSGQSVLVLRYLAVTTRDRFSNINLTALKLLPYIKTPDEKFTIIPINPSLRFSFLKKPKHNNKIF